MSVQSDSNVSVENSNESAYSNEDDLEEESIDEQFCDQNYERAFQEKQNLNLEKIEKSNKEGVSDKTEKKPRKYEIANNLSLTKNIEGKKILKSIFEKQRKSNYQISTLQIGTYPNQPLYMELREPEPQKEKFSFLRRTSKSYQMQKIDWSKIKSRVNCWKGKDVEKKPQKPIQKKFTRSMQFVDATYYKDFLKQFSKMYKEKKVSFKKTRLPDYQSDQVVFNGQYNLEDIAKKKASKKFLKKLGKEYQRIIKNQFIESKFKFQQLIK